MWSRGLLAAFLSASIAFSQNNQDEALGLIIKLSGKWLEYPGQKQLSVGDFVFPSRLILSKSVKPALIEIGLFDGKVWRQDCSSGSPCEYHLPSHLSEEKLSDGSLQARLMRFFKPDREMPPIFAVSRSLSVDFARPHESVLLYDEEKCLNVQPAFKSLPEGKYKAHLKSQSSSNSDEPESASFSVHWPQQSCITLELIPGLYDLQANLPGKPATTSMVLISSHDHFEQASKSFQLANHLLTSWNSNGVVDPEAHRVFLIHTLIATQAELSTSTR